MLIWTRPSFFVLFWDFPDFLRDFPPICPGIVRGFSRFVLFLFLGLLTAPTRNSPERVQDDTIWTFPEKVGNPPVWKPPGLPSLKLSGGPEALIRLTIGTFRISLHNFIFELLSASSKPTRICTAPFEQGQTAVVPSEGVQIWVCLFLYGRS